MGASAQGGVQPMGQPQAIGMGQAGVGGMGQQKADLDGTMTYNPSTMSTGSGAGGGWGQMQSMMRGQMPQFGGVQQQNYQGGGDVFSNASAGLNQAMQGTQQGMGYQPMNINAGQIAGQTMQYMNPYENQVVGQTLSDLDRARQMQANQLDAQASSAGAFGGSRQALMQSELGRNFLNQAATSAGQLRQAGWNQGQNLAMQAAQANQGAGLQGANLRLNAAQQQGNLANLGFGMGQQTQAMQQQSGTIAQAINQALIDAAKGQFGGFTGAPAQSLGYMASALGATPASSTTTNSRNPGLFDYLTLGATALGGK